MATDVYFECEECHEYLDSPSMFRALVSVVELVTDACPECSGTLTLHLDFHFATGTSGANRCKVLAAFLPPDDVRPKWEQEDDNVEFFPFLVVLEQIDNGEPAIWLPYWHVKSRRDRTRLLYGQWAPFMDLYVYSSLMSQARARGYDV